MAVLIGSHQRCPLVVAFGMLRWVSAPNIDVANRMAHRDHKPSWTLISIHLSPKHHYSARSELFYLCTSLLRFQAVKVLVVVCFVDDNASSCAKIFQGTASIAGERTIPLVPNATPYAVSAPQWFPVPMKEKVKRELHKLEWEEFILKKKVEEPTEWCDSTFLVIKASSGAIFQGDTRREICRSVEPFQNSGFSRSYLQVKLTNDSHIAFTVLHVACKMNYMSLEFS